MSRYTTVSVEVDVDLAEIEDDDLLEELERRRMTGVTNCYMTASDAKEQLEAIHHHMKMKQPEAALELMYNYVRDVLGKAV